ncbi:hypothetical protein BBJ28_00004979 [Nothophytophthora sp. Chile5]|nr:hypothetical protein BBJ28_00004979 [Nothophytophthora sp. Chile5]
MSNITDATCDFGLAQTAAGCVRTLASYDLSAYRSYQIGYCVVGLMCLVASVFMAVRSVRHEGSPLQQANFLFCCYASLTVAFRGIDPGSYGHVIPLPIFGLLSDTCTASLYSVLERGAIVVVWIFYSANDLFLFMYKGFQPESLIYEELIGSACVLGIISSTFLVYGLRVLSRLQEYERLKKMQMPIMLERTVANQSFNMELSDDEDGVPVVDEPSYVRRRPQNGHAAKIRKILIVAETVSLIVIAAQVYMAVSRASETPVELSCANGNLCDTVKTGLNLLHDSLVFYVSLYLMMQVLCVWVILWTFRKIHKKEVVPQPH